MNDDLKVYYPYGGKHFLIQWWSYSDHNHIVLARNKDAAIAALMSKSQKYSDAKVKGFFEIDIVAPPKLYGKLSKELRHKENVQCFHLEVVCRLKAAVKMGKELPLPFELCYLYEPDEEVDMDEWARDTHYNCKNCKDTIRLVGMTNEELYERYNADWQKVYPSREDKIDPKLVVSRGDVAGDNEELYYALRNFGHHCSGIELEKVDMAELDKALEMDCSPIHIEDGNLFFYRMLGEIDYVALNGALREREDYLADMARDMAARQKADRRSEEKELVEGVLRFFGGEKVLG